MDKGKKYRIVVVDDDTISLRNAKAILSGDQIRVSSVRSGRELLTYLQTHEPDLILLDVVMPEMDGFETFIKIRELEEAKGRRQVPVIFLSGASDSEIENRGLEIGASDFVRKPIDRDILIKRIENTIVSAEMIKSLTEEVHTDSLTGFYNKSGTDSRMKELCHDGHGMLMVLDLDNFKLINDLYGHDMGDRVLKAFADVTRESTREDDVLCRIGGDEFLVYMRHPLEKETVRSFTRRLNDGLLERCSSLMGELFDVPIGVSIGAVRVPVGGDYEELFAMADKALYQVKQGGKHSFSLCSAEVEEEKVSEVENPDEEMIHMLRLNEERGESERAMIVGRESFTSIYRFVVRFAIRNSRSLTCILFSLKEEDGAPGGLLEPANETLRDILLQNLRKDDVITQAASGAFFILMPDMESGSEEVVLRRIAMKWEECEYSRYIGLINAVDCHNY